MERRRVTLGLVACLLAMFAGLSAPLGATKPTAPARTPEERAALEALRGPPGLAAPEARRRFVENLARDCEGWAYGGADMDLTVESVARTHPETVALDVLAIEGARLCPMNFAKLCRWLEPAHHARVVPLARTYLATHEQDGTYWPFNYRDVVQQLVTLIARNGKPEDMDAFRRFYCRYRDQGYDREGPGRIVSTFLEACPTVKPEQLTHCGPWR